MLALSLDFIYILLILVLFSDLVTTKQKQ